MKRSGNPPATAERGWWLAELADAVAEAQRVTQSLSVTKGNRAEVDILYGRLELVRIEVEELRRGGWTAGPTNFAPKWTSLFPW